jgi:hypothetical protein
MSNPLFFKPPSIEEQQAYFREVCEKRAISDELAKTYGFYIKTSTQVNEEYRLGHQSALFPTETAFAIPYHDFDWEPIPNRESIRRSGGQRDDKGKVKNKYLRKAGVKGACLYLPYREDWHDARQDIKKPLWVVEGEFKTFTLHEVLGESQVVVGISGANMFAIRDAATGNLKLPQLWEGFDTNGRELVYCYDADRKPETHEQTMAGIMKAALCVQQQGGRVYMIDLTLTEVWKEGTLDKLGVDDFFIEYGGTLEELYQCKVPVSIQLPRFQELHNTWMFCEVPQGFVNRETGEFVKDTAWNSRVGNYIDFDKDSKPVYGYTRFRQAADRPTVHGITFIPNGDRVVNNYLNIWNGWPEHGDGSKSNAYAEFVAVVLALCGDDDGNRLLDFIAHMFQSPEEKPQHAFLLQGYETGTGKSTICYAVMQVAGEYGVKVDDSQLFGRFNKVLENKLWVWWDEPKSSEKGTYYVTDKVSDFITMPTIRIESKGVDNYNVPHYASLIMASNDAAPLAMRPTERRTNVVNCDKGLAKNPEHIKRCERLNNLRGDDKQSILDGLMARDISGYDSSSRAVVTSAMEEMIELSRGNHDLAAVAFLELLKTEGKDKDGMFWKPEEAYSWASEKWDIRCGVRSFCNAVATASNNLGMLHQTSSPTEQVQIAGLKKGRWVSWTGKRWKDSDNRGVWDTNNPGKVMKYT